MTLAVAEALNPNKPNQINIFYVLPATGIPVWASAILVNGLGTLYTAVVSYAAL